MRGGALAGGEMCGWGSDGGLTLHRGCPPGCACRAKGGMSGRKLHYANEGRFGGGYFIVVSRVCAPACVLVR